MFSRRQPESDGSVLRRVEEVSADVKTLKERLEDFRESVATTHANLGKRIGTLEGQEQVRDEQYKHINDKLEDVTREMAEFKRENKDSIAELRKEHKDSMAELKAGNKEILDALNPLKHKVEDLELMKKDVDEIQKKPGETWEHLKKQTLVWGLLLILAIVAAALGLEKFL
ncbi:MAG: hypothetical protein NC432_08835 [Roseburia sp.]|nr:hypothetical protein [Roseburia sp.]